MSYYKNEFQKAIADFTKAIEIDPNFEAAYRHRGDTYQLMGEKELAQADRKKADELKP